MTAATREVTATPRADTPVRRVRKHLHLVTRQGQPAKDERHLSRDLRTIVQRLRGVHARGGALEGVELGPQVREVMKTLEIVGSEILVLNPERKRA